jgi:hypothetical protein
MMLNTFGLPVTPGAVSVMVPVRIALSGFAVAEIFMTPELVPLAPDVICNQEFPAVIAAVQSKLPPPALDTSKEAVPEVKSIDREAGDAVNTGGLVACIMVTVFGLPVAPNEVMVITPVRSAVSLFASVENSMVPALIPVDPEVIRNQEAPVVTAAVQFMVPAPVLVTLNVDEPAVEPRVREAGEMVRMAGGVVKFTVNEIVDPAEPMLVISMPPGAPELRKQAGLVVALNVVLPDSAEKWAELISPLAVVMPFGLKI